MKRSIGLALLFSLGVLLALGGWGWYRMQQPRLPSVELDRRSVQVQVPTPSLPPPSASPVTPPRVNGDRLFRHVQALNFPRYTEADRQQARNYLLETLGQVGWAPQPIAFTTGVNITAFHPGTDAKAGTLLVGAHYDTVPNSPGADDNGTGVAAVLEIAQLLGDRPSPRGLQLVLFDREEQGLEGSLAFVRQAANTQSLQGAIILEMLGFTCQTPGCQKLPQGIVAPEGSDRGNFLAVIGDQEHLSLLQAFQTRGRPAFPPVLTLPVPLRGLATPDLLRSDHAPFWMQGIGAVMVTDTANFRTPHYHQPSDTPSTLDRAFLTGAVQVVVNAITQLL